MIISDTSALVLNWTSKDVWKSDNARKYFESLDLTSADSLYKRFDEQMNLIQTHLLTNRKFFIRKCVVDFLEQCKTKNEPGQVIILAAGIDPLSVEIASLYPYSKVFDVDKYSMQEKEKHLNGISSNIKFIECDITNTKLLKENLLQNGWDENQSSIVIIEGITYYLTEEELKKIFAFFAQHVSNFACDFGINPECVIEKNRMIGVEIVSKVTQMVNIEFMNCYTPDCFLELIEQSGFENVQRFKMAEIQKERTGEITPFEEGESAWVTLVKN